MPFSVKPGFHSSPKGLAQIDELDFEIRTARAEFCGENARRLPKNAAPVAAAGRCVAEIFKPWFVGSNLLVA
nr:hypothetical protein [Neorhizobium tomejilense]